MLVSVIIIRSTGQIQGIHKKDTEHGWRNHNDNNDIEKHIHLMHRKQ